jgi:hypothetical protein
MCPGTSGRRQCAPLAGLSFDDGPGGGGGDDPPAALTGNLD